MDPQDRERHKRQDDQEPDVEAHRFRKASDDQPRDETEKDEPDVEAHRFKA